MLSLDHYNNSAWNMRWFVVSRTAVTATAINTAASTTATTTTSGEAGAAETAKAAALPPTSPTPPPPPSQTQQPLYARAAPVESWPEAIVLREIDYCFSWIVKAPANESPWSYLRGLMREKSNHAATAAAAAPSPKKEGGQAVSSGGGGWRFSRFPTVKQRILALRKGGEAGAYPEEGAAAAAAAAASEEEGEVAITFLKCDACIPLLGLLLEVLQNEAATITPAASTPESLAAWSEAKELCAELAVVDAVRAPYWAFRMEQLNAMPGSA